MIRFITSTVFILFFLFSQAQTRKLVWSDEFNGTKIDTSTWSFAYGPTNDNVHYYTNRIQNATIADGHLQLIALSESYSGYNYTSALVQTKKSVNWKYGRIEARIKLPSSKGFVPAFWLLPSDDMYGWWPNSGEIDIMEHPTNLVNLIYGTIHTGTYNTFTGSGSIGSNIEIQDAETQFHIYAIEWTSEKIDFYVDQQKYFTFNNEHSGPGTWPFEHPFYIILNLAVGGGWVGLPDNSSIFPARMEIDYVRVYQYLNDMSINGDDFVLYNSHSVPYAVPEISGAEYAWTLPSGAQIISGNNTHRIMVNFGIPGGDLSCDLTTNEGAANMKFPVHVSSNLINNPGFEHGVKYWNKTSAYPGDAEFALTSSEQHAGKYSVKVSVENQGIHAWDISLTNKDFQIVKNKSYHLTFWAKTENELNDIQASVIDPINFTIYGQATFSLTKDWSQYKLDFTASETRNASLNIDMGNCSGNSYFDDFVLTTNDLAGLNLVANSDFSEGMEAWILTTGWPAVATETVINGACNVMIDNGGSNAWDVNLSQSNIYIKQGVEYTLTFDASSDAPRQFSAFVGKNTDPWTVYSGSHVLSTLSGWHTFEFSFLMQQPTDDHARIGFDLGNDTENISIDNVILREKNMVSGLNSNKGPDILFEIIPNPVHSVATIKYDLDYPSHIQLRVYNESGNVVAILAESFEIAGEHSILWDPQKLPDGNYFCHLQVGNYSFTRKIILLTK